MLVNNDGAFEIEMFQMKKQFILMNDILSKLEQSGNWKEQMRFSCKKNGLKTSLSNELTILKLRSLGSRFRRSYESLGERVATIWIQNQLKAYHWLLVALSFTRNRKIEEFDQQQWATLGQIFRYKSRHFLKYEAKRLVITKVKNKPWSEQQNDMLRDIVAKSDGNQLQWNDIARTMFELSNQAVFRTGKQCRERWLNYLDPSKQRGEWTRQEDYALLCRVQQSGKKWSEYACEMNRTEHTVKNRFNSLIIRQRRTTPQIHRQQKLIELIKSQLKGSEHSHESQDQSSQKEKEIGSSLRQNQPQLIEKMDEIPVELEKAPNNQNIQQVGQPRQGQVEEKELPGIMRFVRNDEEVKNCQSINEFSQLYSPFWTYSPSNGTPNGFMNSPSPLSFYINYSFTSTFHRFTGQMPNNFSSSQPPQQNQ